MWWQNYPSQKFWLEATDRNDIGADLRAPEFDESGEANWRYTLFKLAHIGDIVLHYDKGGTIGQIVGWSKVAGAPIPSRIIWGARGSYARKKGSEPHPRNGYIVPLVGYRKLKSPVTLAALRAKKSGFEGMLAGLRARYGSPLYFPFEVSHKRPLRLLQGYAFKLPIELIFMFPELAMELQVSSASTSGAAQPDRSPKWTRDELILALELYKRFPTSPPSKSSAEVAELSEVLNRMAGIIRSRGEGRYRNPNGVYMKLMNFRRFDPLYTSDGRVGLTRGNKDEELVWNEFAADSSRLARVAEAIRAATSRYSIVENHDDFEGVEAPEGRILTKMHRFRERNQTLVERRKQSALRQHGSLRCEACSFDFEQRYGTRGSGLY